MTFDVNLATESEKIGHSNSIEENWAEVLKEEKRKGDKLYLVKYSNYWRKPDIEQKLNKRNIKIQGAENRWQNTQEQVLTKCF